MGKVATFIVFIFVGIVFTCCAAIQTNSAWHPCIGHYIAPGAQSPCVFYCYNSITGWSHGSLGDGAACMLPYGLHAAGQCIRGVCIQKSPPRHTECDGVYRGKGYAPSCHYKCRDIFVQRMRHNYLYGTPCLNTDKQGNPFGAAGFCKNGYCIEHDDLEVAHTGPVRYIFLRKYHKCPIKRQKSKDITTDCHHYCKKRGAWYYGLYEDYTKCQLPDQKIRGVCCRGTCHIGKRCNRAE